MTSIVVTSFSAAGAKQYGHRAVRFFQARCRVPLVVYLDAPDPTLTRTPGLETRFTAEIDGWREAAGHLPMHNPMASRPDRYTWHARRFGVKPFVWWDAARRLGSGIVTWLDGDTQATAPIPEPFFASLLDGADVAYLGRGAMHPETGYVGFRVPEALPLLQWCRDAFATGLVRSLDGWTDCHVLRAGLQAVPMKARDLTTARYTGRSHIWPVSPLAPYLTHYKGAAQKRLVRV